ncbi:MAG: hypothetical protein H7Y20_14735, partial [Bryobacteraceae bacterium]|nr:hypothetical protein [Bryobacteraceae bacterium]
MRRSEAQRVRRAPPIEGRRTPFWACSPEAFYKAALQLYPADFRHEYGSEMLLVFSEQLTEARRGGGKFSEILLWLRATLDVMAIAPQEHWHVILQDIRYAFRQIA